MSEVAKTEKELQDVITIASKLIVTSNDEETFALAFLKVVKKIQEDVGIEFDQKVSDSYALYKSLYAQRGKYLDPLTAIEKDVRQKMKNYRLALELKRQEEQAKQKAILDAQVKADQDKLMAQAEAAQAAGNKDEADKLAVKATNIEAGGVWVESKAVKQDGMSSSIVWKGRVVDLTSLPLEFVIITPNQKAIDAHIKAHGKNLPIKGVEYFQDVDLRVRA